MLKKSFVSELKLGTEVTIPLALYEKRLSQYTGRDGRPAHGLMMTVGDKTGRMAAVAWDKALDYHSFLVEDRIYLFTARVNEYRGQLQLVVSDIQEMAPAQVDLTDYLPSAPFPREVMWRRLKDVFETIQQPHLRSLLAEIFDLPTQKKFMLAPGGREVHHAYVGGLLEHTLEVVAYAETMVAEQGAYLNRDLLITACILHDIGKIEEYDLHSLSFQVTDKGKLLGHLQMGAQMVTTAAARIPNFPAALRLELEHMLLSHHGLPEWGAVQQPKTINAMALHLADLTSGRLAQFGRILAAHASANGKWSSFDRFLGRSIFVSDRP